MKIRDRFKAAAAFLLAWLSTPSSKTGIVTIVTAFIGNGLAPHIVEGIVQAAIIGAGIALVMWPDRPKP